MSTKFPDLRSVSKKDRPSAQQMNALTAQVKHLSRLSGPGVSTGVHGPRITPKRRNEVPFSFRSPPPSFLQLTQAFPPGYVLPPLETRTPIFVTFGTFGNSIPSGLDEPVEFVDPSAGDGERYIGALLNLSQTVVGFVSSASLISETTIDPFLEEVEFVNGQPPTQVKILLGVTTASGGLLSLTNTGNGSFSISSFVSGLSTQAGATAVSNLFNFNMNLTWVRNTF